MTTVHMIVGSLVVLGYAVTLALNAMTLTRGTEFSWQRMVSFGAATLLILQYMLGFSLLGEGRDIPASHYLIALATLIPVGLEHMYAGTRATTRQRGMMGTILNVATLVLVLVAYMIGETNS